MNFELTMIGAAGLVALGTMNFRLGRCFWRRMLVAELITGLLSGTLVIACILQSLLAYCPRFTLKSPLTMVLSPLGLAGATWVFCWLFHLGCRTNPYYIPNPNKTYDKEDLPGPEPTTATPTTK